MTNALRTAALLTLLALPGCMRASATIDGTPLGGSAAVAPTLLVFITVDQLRGDMLARYASDMRAGYGRLMREGAWFVNAFQDHSITETAPGHASTMSGRFPRSTGIASNSAGVVDPKYQLLAAFPNEIGASPDRFQGTTIFDWLHARDGRTRALSVSAKDRGAILTVGNAKQEVYWYSNLGTFTTSTYYADTMPAWVHEFNARRIPYSFAGGAWRLSRDTGSYAMPDAVAYESRGQNFVFPHAFPADTIRAANMLRATPYMDSVTALFALAGVRQMGLGRGPHTDILAVSFSATDYVGHGYGPDSREAYENQLRLDETIGWFLDSLSASRGASSMLVVLTADHGVQPIPELARERGEATANQGLRVSLRTIVSGVRGRLFAAGVDSAALYYDGEHVAVDRATLRRARLDADSVLSDFAAQARAVPGIARVDRPRDLRRADPALDPIARRWAHQLPEDSPMDLVITLTRYSLWSSIPASHGSPYDHDAHVPVIFYGPSVRAGRYTQFARVVDIAPTLAAILGVRPLERLDGVVLTQAIR